MDNRRHVPKLCTKLANGKLNTSIFLIFKNLFRQCPKTESFSINQMTERHYTSPPPRSGSPMINFSGNGIYIQLWFTLWTQFKKTTSYVPLLSNSMGLTFGKERKNVRARWNKSSMLSLCLNMDWLHIYYQKNPVHSTRQSMSGAKLNQHLQTLSVAGSKHFLLGLQCLFFSLPFGIDANIFSPFRCKSEFHGNGVCVVHHISAALLCCLWKDMIFTKLGHFQ